MPKTAYWDGTTHRVMSPPEFMRRLAALVLRPDSIWYVYHSVLALNAKLRAKIIPDGKKSKPADANVDVSHSPDSLRSS